MQNNFDLQQQQQQDSLKKLSRKEKLEQWKREQRKLKPLQSKENIEHKPNSRDTILASQFQKQTQKPAGEEHQQEEDYYQLCLEELKKEQVNLFRVSNLLKKLDHLKQKAEQTGQDWHQKYKWLFKNHQTVKNEYQKRNEQLIQLEKDNQELLNQNEKLTIQQSNQQRTILSLKQTIEDLKQELSIKLQNWGPTSAEMEALREQLCEKEALLEQFTKDYVPKIDFEHLKSFIKDNEKEKEEMKEYVEALENEVLRLTETPYEEMWKQICIELETYKMKLFEEEEKIVNLEMALKETLADNKKLYEAIEELSHEDSIVEDYQDSCTQTDVPILNEKTSQTDCDANKEMTNRDIQTDPDVTWLKRSKEIEFIINEYNSFKFANSLMYEQMNENQKKYKEQTDKLKKDVKFWKESYNKAVNGLENQAMQALTTAMEQVEKLKKELEKEKDYSHSLLETVKEMESLII